MQPMPTSQHPGPAEPEDSGPAAPVHGTAVPAPRHIVGANPITEATTEMPLIVPKSPDLHGPSPLPPIATQLLGGVTHLPAPEPPAGQPADTDTDAAAEATEARPEGDNSQPDADVTQRDPDAVEPDAVDAESDKAAPDTAEPSADAAPVSATIDGQPENPDAVAETEPAVDADTAAEDDDDEDLQSDALTAHGDAGDLAYIDDEYDTDDESTDEYDDEQDEESAAVVTTVDEQVEPAVGSDAEPVADAPATDASATDASATDEPVAEEQDADEAVDEASAVEPAAAGAAAKRPGDVSMPPITIWSEAAADDLRDEWHEIKARFVDEPDVAVMQAQSLVAHTVRTLAERLLAEQLELDPHRHSELPDTESMRMALRHYREFLDRLLAI